MEKNLSNWLGGKANDSPRQNSPEATLSVGKQKRCAKPRGSTPILTISMRMQVGWRSLVCGETGRVVEREHQRGDEDLPQDASRRRGFLCCSPPGSLPVTQEEEGCSIQSRHGPRCPEPPTKRRAAYGSLVAKKKVVPKVDSFTAVIEHLDRNPHQKRTVLGSLALAAAES